MNRQPDPHPMLAPANHAAAFAGLAGQQRTSAVQARSMLPPPLPQPRLAPHNQFGSWAPDRFFPVQLDRLYNLFPVIQQHHPRGSQDLSMAPPNFYNNYFKDEPPRDLDLDQLRARVAARLDLDLDQLRARVAALDQATQQAPAQQVQPAQHAPANQAALAPQAPPTIPTWRLIYQVSPFAWSLAEVVQVRKFDQRASPTDRMLTGDSFRSFRHHPVYALLGSESPAIAKPCCSRFIGEQSILHRVLLRNEPDRPMRPVSSQLL
jgi:hypothetical protein